MSDTLHPQELDAENTSLTEQFEQLRGPEGHRGCALLTARAAHYAELDQEHKDITEGKRAVRNTVAQ